MSNASDSISISSEGQFLRPEFEIEVTDGREVGDVSRELSLWEQISTNGTFRKTVILLVLAIIWEVYARFLDNPLMFPTFTDVLVALWNATIHGPLLARLWVTMKTLLAGYCAGIALAAAFTIFAMTSRLGQDVLSTLTAMFNPLPAIGLLPLALLWFGMGNAALVFIMVHSVLWPVALSTLSGFQSISESLRMAGMNFGLRGIRYVLLILIPAAFVSILAGLRIGWAFAWRSLIAAELVFGAASGSGGLGWYIFESRNQLNTADVFAGLFAVILIGLLVENVIFRGIENRTVVKWGMRR